MIRVRVQGGLGNQLFQWGAGLHLSALHRRKVIFDLSWYRHKTSDASRPLEVLDLVQEFGSVSYNSAVTRLVYSRRNPWVTYESSKAQATLGSVRRGWLSGFFQDAHAVGEVHNDALTRLVERRYVSPESHGNFAALHVRLGDYFHDPTTRAFHGVLSPDYFERAIEFLQGRTNIDGIRVFTDDPEVFRSLYSERIRLPYEISAAADARSALYEMSTARHILMSNSSLSWWAAFAVGSRREESAILYPDPWLARPSSFDQCIAFPCWTAVERPNGGSM